MMRMDLAKYAQDTVGSNPVAIVSWSVAVKRSIDQWPVSGRSLQETICVPGPGHRETERTEVAWVVGNRFRWLAMDQECRVVMGPDVGGGSLLYNVGQAQYNPEVLQACELRGGERRSWLERGICREYAAR